MSGYREWVGYDKVDEFAKEKIIVKDMLIECTNVDMMREFRKWYEKKYGKEDECKLDETGMENYIKKAYGRYGVIMYKCDENDIPEAIGKLNDDIIIEFVEENIRKTEEKGKVTSLNEIYQRFREWMRVKYSFISRKEYNRLDIKQYLTKKYEMKGERFIGIELMEEYF